jgi:hypothetical protein
LGAFNIIDPAFAEGVARALESGPIRESAATAGKSIAAIFTEEATKGLSDFDVSKATSDIEKRFAQLAEVESSIRQKFKRQREIDAANTFASSFSGFQLDPNDIFGLTPKAREGKKPLLEEQLDALKKLTAAQREALTVAQLTDKQAAVHQAIVQVTNALTKSGIDLSEEAAQVAVRYAAEVAKEVDKLQDLKKTAEDLKTPQEKFAERQKQLLDFVAAHPESRALVINALRDEINALDAATTGWGAYTDALKGAEVNAVTLGAELGGVLNGAVQSVSDSIAELAVSGDFKNFKEAISQLLRQLAKEIIAVIIQFVILKSIQRALGGASTGAATSAVDTAIAGAASGGPVGGFRKFQAGGFPPREPVIVGEKGPELFVPTQRGNIIPNSRMQAPQVNLNVVNVTDPNEVVSVLNSQQGEETVLNILAKNPRVIQQLAGR